MLNKLFYNMRFSPNIIRLRVQGPLNTRSEFQINQKINRIQQLRSQALLVVVNSYGGSLQSAKNISARLKKLSINKNIPIYCFAEQFCLNSANLILTTGTKCFAHKFSVIGDFGYVYEGIETEEFQRKYGLKENQISSMKKTYRKNIFGNDAVPLDKQFIKKIVNESQQSLKEQIFQNRYGSLTKVQQEQFIHGLQSNEGFFNLQKSVDMGLIDGITGVQDWILQNCKGKKIVQGAGFQLSNSLIKWMKSINSSIKFSDKQ